MGTTKTLERKRRGLTDPRYLDFGLRQTVPDQVGDEVDTTRLLRDRTETEVLTVSMTCGETPGFDTLVRPT